jgi:hypothetical protein
MPSDRGAWTTEYCERGSFYVPGTGLVADGALTAG